MAPREIGKGQTNEVALATNRTVFQAALERGSPAGSLSRRSVCRDSSLRREVESLIAFLTSK